MVYSSSPNTRRLKLQEKLLFQFMFEGIYVSAQYSQAEGVLAYLREICYFILLTLGKVIYFTQFTDSNDYLIQNTLTDMPKIMFD